MALIDCLRNLGLVYRSVRAQDQQFLEHNSVLGKYSQRGLRRAGPVALPFSGQLNHVV